MCVILHLTPGAMMKKEHLVNAVHNNHHSWGLVLVDGNNRSQLINKCPEEGKYDPEEIWDVLEDNKDIHRYLHLRNTTKGATNLENTQPFRVYTTDQRQVFFFHNGTLSGFGAAYGNNIGISDSKDFSERVLIPALLRWSGVNGPADYNDPFFDSLIMDKQWTMSSKGLFVSNDMPPKYYGSGWTKYVQDDKDAPVIMTSNTDYFNMVKRGPAHKAPEVATYGIPFQGSNSTYSKTAQVGTVTETKKSLAVTGNTSNTAINPLGMLMTPVVKNSQVINSVIIKNLEKFFENIPNDPEVDQIDYSCLSKVSYEEWETFCSDDSSDVWTIAAMLDLMSTALAKEYTLRKELGIKLKKAEKHIVSIKNEVKNDQAA